MAGQTIIMDCVKGDEVVVYAYTGTWLADFPMNHYTHWVGLLLKPSQEEVCNQLIFDNFIKIEIEFQADQLKKEAYESA